MARVYVVQTIDPYPVDEVAQKSLVLAWLQDLVTRWAAAGHPTSRQRWVLLYRPSPGSTPARFPLVNYVPDALAEQHGLGQSYVVVLTDVEPAEDLPADQILRIRVDPRTWPTVA